MAEAVVGAQRLHYEDTGGDLPAVLFSHSFGMTGAMFAPQLAAFRDTHRCITWDERAHGGSPAEGPFTFWDSARDAIGLLDHLGLDHAIFVGTSQGGFLSMRAALLAPGRVRGLAILGSSAAAEDPAQRDAFMAVHDAFVADPAGPPAQVIDAMAHISLGDYAESEPWKARWRTWRADQFSLAFHALIERDDITARLGEIVAPTLVLHGSHDHSYPPARGEAIARGVTHGAGFIVVENGAHFLSLTDAGRANAELRSFFSQL